MRFSAGFLDLLSPTYFGAYRVIYVARQTRATSKRDLDIARRRFTQVLRGGK